MADTEKFVERMLCRFRSKLVESLGIEIDPQRQRLKRLPPYDESGDLNGSTFEEIS